MKEIALGNQLAPEPGRHLLAACGKILTQPPAGASPLSANRGLKAGRFAFTHDPRLATDRSNCPFWFWGQFALIICMIVVLVLGAAL